MEPISIIVKNYKSYGDEETIIPLNDKTVRLLIGKNGCLTGDTKIRFNRCKKGFETTIEKAYMSWNNISYQGSKGWDKSFKTYVRSYKEDINEISLHEIDDIVYNGEKEVYLLKLENGNKIKATKNHKFMTKKGFIKLKDLIMDSEIMIDNISRFSKIEQIKFIGKEKVYDIICKDPYRNFSANGMIVHNSGKTTFVDAIIWCLYGKSLCNVDEVVNRKIKKNCKVEFTFNINKEEYSIIRYRKHDKNGNKLLIFKNNKNISPLKMNEAQSLIIDIIGINYEAMVSSIILSSELYSSFLRERCSERLKMIESVLSMKQINKWADATKKLRKPITDKISDVKSEIDIMNVGINTLNKNIADYKEQVKNTLLNLKTQKMQMKEQFEETKARLSELKEIDYIQELKKNEKFKEIENYNKDIEKQIEEKEKKFYDITVLAEELQKIKTNLTENNKINIDKELVKIRKYNEDVMKNNEIEKEILKFENEIINVKDLKNTVSSKIKEANSLIVEIENIQLNKCPTCGQKINDEKMIELKKRNIEIHKKKQDEIKDLENKLKNAEDNNKKFKFKTLEKEKEYITIEKPKYDEEFLNNFKEEINKKKTKEAILETEIMQKDSFNAEIKAMIKDLKSKLIKEKTEKSKYSNDFLNNIEKEILDVIEQQKKIEKELIIIDEKAKSTYDKKYVDGSIQKIETLKKALIKIKAVLTKEEKNEKHYNFLLTLLSNRDQGLKKYIISKMIDIFNKQINYFVPLFFDYNVEIEFDKNLLEIIKVEGEQVSFDTFSSGEKARLELAITFSLFMLGKLFFSSPVDFIVFDEILDGNLDEEGLDRVIKIVDGFGNDNSVIVISHNNKMKEYYQNRILINKDGNGFSKVRLESIE
jgi:DNA repair exonuclease SbcCD ATPase subunit